MRETPSVEVREQADRGRQVDLQMRPQLVRHRDPGLDQVAPGSDMGAERDRCWCVGLQARPAVPIAA